MGNHKIVVDSVTKDLQDDYSVTVGSSNGMGIPPVNNLNTEKALQPGATLQGQTYQARNMTWNCSIQGTTQADFHDKRQALFKALDAQTGKINAQMTGIEVQYTGATVDKKINVVYDGGLEGNNWNSAFQEEFALRLRADDPIWKSTATATTTALDSEDSATFRTVAKRETDTSVPIWNELGPPNVSGTYTDIKGIVEDDTYVYFCGDFLNFDNIANADYIVRMNKSTEVFSALGTGANGRVWSMAVDASGNLYAGGDFTSIGGTAAANIAMWNGSTWAAMGSGAGARVLALALANDGTLFIGGSFTNGGGVANADYIGTWDGSAWGAAGTGMNLDVQSLANSLDGGMFAGGTFTTAGGTSVNYVAKWDGSAWAALADGLATGVGYLLVDASGTLYASGWSGAPYNYAGIWNGKSWSQMSAAFTQAVGVAEVLSDGRIIIGGGHLWAATLGNSYYNGSEISPFDLSPNSLYAIDAALESVDGGLYIGMGTSSGTWDFSGDLTIAYAGTAVSYPQITINRSGGTSAKIISLRNETTGATLYFDYDLLDGETLTIEFDLTSTTSGMTSSARGNVYSELRANSNFGTFYLTPGNASGANDNVITLFVDGVGAPTMTSNIIYTDNYISAD